MKRDYYEVLGIDRNATDEDIRKAYRQLALKHHPDVNLHDPAADARFKDINEAYEVLRNADKRAAYDRFGHAAMGNGGRTDVYTDFTNLSDIFDHLFNFSGRSRGRGGRPAPERGDDLRTRLDLSFEEAVFGATRTVVVTRSELCEPCEGSGAAPGSRPVSCTTCSGSGQVRRVQQSVFGSFVNVQTCPACGGRGEVMAERCADCGGQGRRPRKRTLEVDIPAGVEDGLQIRLGQEGDSGRWGGPAGDLFVQLAVAPHPLLHREGNDIHVRLRLGIADAALGATVEVPTLDGPAMLQVPAGTQTGDQFRLEKRGVPFLKRSGRGDQIVTVFVATPTRLTRDQRQLLEALRPHLEEPRIEEREKGGFWEKLRERFG